MKAVVDKTGPGVRTKAIGERQFHTRVKACVSPAFFQWVFGWKGQIRIEGPKTVREKYLELLIRETKHMKSTIREERKKD